MKILIPDTLKKIFLMDNFLRDEEVANIFKTMSQVR